jgi:hypothetical protein
MRRPRLLLASLAVLALSFARAAVAGTVADQLSVGTTTGAPDVPRRTFVSDRLTGVSSPSDTVDLVYDFTVTRDLGAQAPVGSPFPYRGGTIFRGSAGVIWQLSPKWALIASANGSPPSTTSTATTIPFTDATGAMAPLAGDLSIHAASFGGDLTLEHDTLESLPIELIASATVGVVRYETTQKLSMLQLADDTTVSADSLQAQCDANGCSAELQTALAARSPDVVQGYVTLDATAVIRRTDVTAAATYYGYSKDPTQLGYFGVATLGRGPVLGDGTPFGPVRYSLRPQVMPRLGRLRLGLAAEYDNYVEDLGTSLIGSVKPAFNFTPNLRGWFTLTMQRDEFAGNTWTTLSGAMGVRWAY